MTTASAPGTTCGNCGYHNPLGANFCASCGTDISSPRSDATTRLQDPAVDTSKPDEGMLVVRKGPKRGSRISLDTDLITIGRHPDSDIFLDDITVSRRHAEVRRDGARYWVRDVGSLNGTYVNRERTDDRELIDGDELQVGKFKLVFVHGTGGR